MSDTAPTIVAMGGGGFAPPPENPLLGDFALSLAASESPRVCLIPTATGDSPVAIVRFHAAMQERSCVPSHLTLFGRPRTDIRDFLLSQDVIYVGGGNTANMLAVWRVHGVDEILREAWEAGIVLCGVSAGMICWFEAGVTDSFGPLRGLDDGLGFLPGSACPHYDGEVDRQPTYTRLVADGFPAGLAADDGAALVYCGAELVECVSARPEARCFRVTRDPSGQAVEESLPVRYLGT